MINVDLKRMIFLLIVAAIISCGSSADGTGGGASGAESIPEAGIDSTEYDPDASDGVSPGGLPTIIEGTDSTVIMTCSEGITTTDGLAQVTCLGLIYYFACDDGDIVIGGSPDGTGTKYTDCSSVVRNCGSGGGVALASSDCIGSQVSMSDYLSGESDGGDADGDGEEDNEEEDEGSNGDDGSETETVTGSITSTDSYGSCSALSVPLYYDIHSIEGDAGEKIEIFIEGTHSDGTEALSLYLALYDPNNFDSTNLISCGDTIASNSSAGDWEDGIADISTEIPTDGTYWIVVEGFFTEETNQEITYTLTWTLTD